MRLLHPAVDPEVPQPLVDRGVGLGIHRRIREHRFRRLDHPGDLVFHGRLSHRSRCRGPGTCPGAPAMAPDITSWIASRGGRGPVRVHAHGPHYYLQRASSSFTDRAALSPRRAEYRDERYRCSGSAGGRGSAGRSRHGAGGAALAPSHHQRRRQYRRTRRAGQEGHRGPHHAEVCDATGPRVGRARPRLRCGRRDRIIAPCPKLFAFRKTRPAGT